MLSCVRIAGRRTKPSPRFCRSLGVNLSNISPATEQLSRKNALAEHVSRTFTTTPIVRGGNQHQVKFLNNRKNSTSSPNRPGRVAVALVAPQQSVNVGAVARIMATFGHTDLYVSPQDGGFDAMCPGDIIVDFSPTNKTVTFQIAPLLSPFHGRDAKDPSHPPFDHLTEMNYANAVGELPMSSIMRFIDIPEAAPLEVLLSQIESNPRGLLPFLLPLLAQDPCGTSSISAYITDRLGARYARTATMVNSFFPHSRLCIEVPRRLLPLEAQTIGVPPGTIPSELVKFGFEVSRIGVPQFQGPPSAMWAPYHAAYTVAHAMNSRDTSLEVQPTQHENVQLYIKSEGNQSGQGSQDSQGDDNNATSHAPATGSEEPPSLFASARLHPAVAISSTSYFAATKSGAEVLDHAKLYYDLGDLMSKFDVVVGTSAMFKTPPKRLSPFRAPVLKPWEIDWVNLTKYTSQDEVEPGPEGDIEGPSMLIVLGRESSGLTARELDMCDYLVTIPGPNQLGGTNFSLNLAQACACVLYEITRAQRLFTEVIEPMETVEEIQQTQTGSRAETETEISTGVTMNEKEESIEKYETNGEEVKKSRSRIRYEAMLEGKYRGLMSNAGVKMTEEGRANVWSISKDFVSQLDPRFTLHEGPSPSDIAHDSVNAEPAQYSGTMSDYYTNLSGLKELDQSLRDVAAEGRTAMHPTAMPHYAGLPVPPSGRSHAEDYSAMLRKIVSRSQFTMTEAKAWINLMKWATKQVVVHRQTIAELSEQIRKLQNRK